MNRNVVVLKPGSFFHNRTGLIAIGLLLTIVLSACGNAPQPNGIVLTQVATDVAATLTAEPTATPTTTMTPTMTPTATPTTTPTATPTVGIPVSGGVFLSSSGCNNSEFLRDVSIPDGTVLSPDETFVKTWRFRNTGSCNWAPEYSLVFVGGRRMGGSNTEIGQTVGVNQRVDISVELTAPDRAGTYIGSWQLVDAFGNTFGDTVDVEIVVEAAPPPIVPTATPIPTNTPIPATPTPVPTNTPKPTKVPTTTPVPTNTPKPTKVPTKSPTAIPTK